jgi:uncharacterized protein (DUF1501 family)
MTKKIDLSRREFIRHASLLSAAGTVATPFALNLFAMNSASAAVLPGYKALVCLYFAGGNDHNNTVIATDTLSMRGYTAARGAYDGTALRPYNTGIALPLGSTSAIDLNNTALSPSFATKTNNKTIPTNDNQDLARTFSLHPELKKLTTRFNGGSTGMKAAVVSNVGPLIQPIHTVAEYKAALKPSGLFSHSDQTAQWQATDPAKQIYGWGGRLADVINANYAGTNGLSQFSCISASGNNVFLSGENIHQYQISANGTATAIGGVIYNPAITNNPTTVFGTTGYLESIITSPNSGNLIEYEHAEVIKRSISAQTKLGGVLSTYKTTDVTGGDIQYTNPNTGVKSNNGLAQQLQTVARLIAGQTVLQAQRQVFFVAVGGFDTHDGQAQGQANLMARIDHAIEYFNTALQTLPGGDMTGNVTLFTASDFGRTFRSNGDGTDHGWGAHHFVVGGAVKGGDIYGAFPATAVSSQIDPLTGVKFDNPLDVGSGNTIPQISVDQYAGTLAKWFGLSDVELNSIFPNLNKFSTTVDTSTYSLGTDLGFMV